MQHVRKTTTPSCTERLCRKPESSPHPSPLHSQRSQECELGASRALQRFALVLKIIFYVLKLQIRKANSLLQLFSPNPILFINVANDHLFRKLFVYLQN